MIPTYDVVILGPSGSGKTVFLGSMYHKLSTMGDKWGFFLEVDAAKRMTLNQIYTEVAFEERWPKATQIVDLLNEQASTWTFTCKVQTPNLGIYAACKFDYIDYAGEIITDFADPTYLEIFNKKIENADALLGLIDGSKLLAYIQGDNLGKMWVAREISNILSYMQNTPKPIHFIISKWDLIEKEYTLDEIIKSLVKIEAFANIIKNRSKKGKEGVVRLIPVSSVGQGFAEKQSDGSMKKTGKMPAPYNVEIPIACVLPDMLSTALNQIIQEQEKKSQELIPEVQAPLNFWDKLKKYFGKTAKNILEAIAPKLPPNFQFSKEILEEVIDFIDYELKVSVYEKEAAARQRTEQLKAKKAEALEKIDNEKTALDYSIKCFMSLVDKLENEHPSSKLTDFKFNLKDFDS